jgi:hypothetical protein
VTDGEVTDAQVLRCPLVCGKIGIIVIGVSGLGQILVGSQ